jgi:signal transduction histidine kinase
VTGIATREPGRDDAARRVRSRRDEALAAGFVIALLAATSWTAPILGFEIAANVAAGTLVIAPVICPWGPGGQTVLVTAGIAVFLRLLPPESVGFRLTSLLVVLVGGGVVSVYAASLLARQRAAADRERGGIRDVTRLARGKIAALASRSGVPDFTPSGLDAHGSDVGVGLGFDELLAEIERLDDALARERERRRRETIREREVNAQFIAQASHEFRTPLTVISTAAQALKYYGSRMSSHLQQVRLANIDISVRHMNDVLSNALAFGRLDGGSVKCEREAVDLGGLAQEVVASIQASSPQHQIVLAAHGAHLAQLDPSLARQVLVNLLTNAVKYSPAGGRIDVDVHTKSERVRFRVSDRGIGIPADEVEHVFDAFGRGSNVDDIPGTGLGLAIVKRAVEVHGGTIDVESRLGEGATFTVVLPTALDATANAGAAAITAKRIAAVP